MPFTLSHPAAVVPLLRGGRARGALVGSALVAGSLAPDVPFFADSVVHGAFGYGRFTHSLLGVPTADVAIAAALVAGWHGLLREPLVALLPDRWADAADTLTAPAGRATGLAGAAWFALSAAIGAATHVGWDAFTHGGRTGVRLLPVLNRTVRGEPLYSLLQYGCSALGLGVLAWYVPRVLRRVPVGRPDARPASGPTLTPAPKAAPKAAPALRLAPRARLAVAALVGAAAAAGAVQRLPAGTSRVLDALPPLAFGGGTGAALGLTCYAALARLPLARRLARPGGRA